MEAPEWPKYKNNNRTFWVDDITMTELLEWHTFKMSTVYVNVLVTTSKQSMQHVLSVMLFLV